MAYRKLLGATGLLAGVFMLTPSFASKGDQLEGRQDRREFRRDVKDAKD